MTRLRLAAALVVMLALALALPSCSGGWLGSTTTTTAPGQARAGASGGSTTAPGVVAPSAPSTTALKAADLRPGGQPPWSGPKISSGVARQVGLEEWTQATNRGSARLVLPADTFLTPSQIVRRAAQAGGWGLVWDDIGTGKPGVLPTGEFCPICGRAVAGVAATGAGADKAAVLRSPIVVQWTDGSAVGYSSTANASRQFVATLFIAGQDRAYQAYSYLSQLHLENLIAQLRFVDSAP
jgi:hypothetical protein